MGKRERERERERRERKGMAYHTWSSVSHDPQMAEGVRRGEEERNRRKSVRYSLTKLQATAALKAITKPSLKPELTQITSTSCNLVHMLDT